MSYRSCGIRDRTPSGRRGCVGSLLDVLASVRITVLIGKHPRKGRQTRARGMPPTLVARRPKNARPAFGLTVLSGIHAWNASHTLWRLRDIPSAASSVGARRQRLCRAHDHDCDGGPGLRFDGREGTDLLRAAAARTILIAWVFPLPPRTTSMSKNACIRERRRTPVDSA